MTLTAENFQRIKQFLLQKGDRKTYCNMYNHNPHYRFSDFDAYLNPSVGQKNINCDPALSDFDELVVYDQNTEQIYYRVKARPEGLHHDASDRARLEDYFDVMLATAAAAPAGQP